MSAYAQLPEDLKDVDVRLKSAASFEQALLTLAIALFPFYIFPSGGLQPSHLAFLLLSLVVIQRHGVPQQRWLLLLGLLTAYALMVEIVASMATGEIRHLVEPAFFLFNFLLLAGVYPVVLRHGAKALRTGVVAATVFAIISTYLGGVELRELSPTGRSTGSFNNPNQLGYFAACILSLAYLLYLARAIHFPMLCVLLAAAVFLSVLSLSKAAMIGNFAVVAFALRPRSRGMVRVVWVGFGLATGVVAAWLVSSGHLDQFLFFDRIANIRQEQDTSLVERGYLAFLDGSVLHTIFGLGSLETQRVVGHEVHSTFASVLNVYGIVGFVIFMPIFVIWGRTLYRAYGPASMFALIGPALLYGITHNGTRFSIFWLLVAASMGQAQRALWEHRQSIERKHHFRTVGSGDATFKAKRAQSSVENPGVTAL